jgi:hypothetical protein
MLAFFGCLVGRCGSFDDIMICKRKIRCFSTEKRMRRDLELFFFEFLGEVAFAMGHSRVTDTRRPAHW